MDSKSKEMDIFSHRIFLRQPVSRDYGSPVAQTCSGKDDVSKLFKHLNEIVCQGSVNNISTRDKRADACRAVVFVDRTGPSVMDILDKTRCRIIIDDKEFHLSAMSRDTACLGNKAFEVTIGDVNDIPYNKIFDRMRLFGHIFSVSSRMGNEFKIRYVDRTSVKNILDSFGGNRISILQLLQHRHIPRSPSASASTSASTLTSTSTSTSTLTTSTATSTATSSVLNRINGLNIMDVAVMDDRHDALACIACMVNYRTTVFKECGHVMLCSACTATYKQKSNTCVYCSTVSDTVHLRF